MLASLSVDKIAAFLVKGAFSFFPVDLVGVCHDYLAVLGCMVPLIS